MNASRAAMVPARHPAGVGQRGRLGLGWRLAPILVTVTVISLIPAVVGDAGQPRVILVGDSVTAGWGASDADHAWPALLRFPAQVDAAPGAASGIYLGRSWSARTVVVELGINDYAQGVSPATYGDHMRQILVSIRAERLVLIVPYRIGREGMSPWDTYADQLETLARSDPRVVLVDLRATFGEPTTELLTADLVHPNDRGHALIARLVSQVVAA